MSIDFAAIAAVALPHVTEWVPGGQQRGHEYVFLNPKRNDTKLGSCSINVNTGRGGDFASGETWGDAVGFYAWLNSTDQPTAARELQDRYGGGRQPDPAPARAEKKSETWEPITPVPEDAPPPPAKISRKIDGTWHALEFVARWAYTDADGHLLGYVCRFQQPNGGKEVTPQSWCRSSDGRADWRWLSFAKPRPLYGLPMLAQYPDATVVIVEGEKTADAARRLLPGYPVLTWPGGSKAVKHADFRPMAGRKVIIWPDADLQTDKHTGELLPPVEQPGMAAALDIAATLDGIAAGVRIVNPPHEKPDGWDLADAEQEGWTNEQTTEWIAQHLHAAREFTDAPAPADEGQAAAGAATPDDSYPYPPDDGAGYGGSASDAPVRHFQALGYNHGVYYYLAAGSHQVIELTASAHTLSNLMTLAPLHHWEREYPGKKGADVAAATNHLMRMCEARGVYDAGRVRGRGAWWDDGRAVLHLGDSLVAGDQQMALTDIRSRYVYEAAAPISADTANPLTATEAHKLVEITDLLNWERPIFGKLLAGWCVIAPICGALPWRPHIWVTGGASTGKTWVMEHIVGRCLGDMGLSVASETTEPGLRQALGHDARPVVFDEAEGENARAQDRIQNVMALMRQASAETSAVILKGGAGGQSKSYRIRSCFAFASIGVGVQQYADKTRVTVLSLYRATGADSRARFQRLKDMQVTTLTEEFCQRLQSRAINMVATIRRNAEIFAAAGAETLGMQRMGDQVGALLAGAYALHSNREITPEQARDWIARQEWSDEAALSDQRDELMCLSAIMENRERVQGTHSTFDRTIGELIAAASGDRFDDNVSPQVAADHLLRLGIKVDRRDAVAVISNTHTAIRKMLANTAWGTNWARSLQRVDGASAREGTVRFGAGAPTRAVQIPLTAFLDASG